MKREFFWIHAASDEKGEKRAFDAECGGGEGAGAVVAAVKGVCQAMAEEAFHVHLPRPGPLGGSGAEGVAGDLPGGIGVALKIGNGEVCGR